MKAKKIVGRVLYSAIGQFLPVAHCNIKIMGKFSKWFRQMCGKLLLVKCGNNVNIYPHAQFSSTVELGDNSDIGLKARLNGRVIIGNDVIMGPEVLVYTVNHKMNDISRPIKYQGESEMEPVIIEDGCWICARAILLPGITIGHDSVVAAGAVVAKDVPPYCVVGGNPARIIKHRSGE